MSHAKVLVKNVKVIDPQSPYNGQVTDILIEDKKIIHIGKIDDDGASMIEADGAFISAGWMDMRVNFCDPGDEHKETIVSGCSAARAGGFTAVAMMPNLHPVTDNKSQIEYILNKSKNTGVQVYVVGALSVGGEGSELAELYDMNQAGAVAFADINKTVSKSGLLVRALQYCQPLGARVLVHCEDKSISSGGKMHEGEMSVSLGLKGIPPLAESIAIARDIEILRYTGGKLHISRVSTAQGVDLIRKAKAEGLDITADVTIHHLVQSDEDLHEFDTNFKHNPPLRSKEHVSALIQGLNDGTIDCIVSDHTPENIENKDVEFDYAASGVIGTQILFSLYQTYLANHISLEKFIEIISSNARKVLGIDIPKIEVGEKIDATLFSIDLSTSFDSKSNCSLSNNSPYIGQELKGRVIQTIS
ncbi:MAG: dihydroorotase [Bacteroidetes bacterium]|nr:dihydroorotase [Bacteroidota bacterium]